MCLERQNNPAATYHLQERVVLEMVMFTVDFFVCLFQEKGNLLNILQSNKDSNI